MFIILTLLGFFVALSLSDVTVIYHDLHSSSATETSLRSVIIPDTSDDLPDALPPAVRLQGLTMLQAVATQSPALTKLQGRVFFVLHPNQSFIAAPSVAVYRDAAARDGQHAELVLLGCHDSSSTTSTGNGFPDSCDYSVRVFLLDLMSERHHYIPSNVVLQVVPEFMEGFSYIGGQPFVRELVQILYSEENFTTLRKWPITRQAAPTVSAVFFDYFYIQATSRFYRYCFDHLLTHYPEVYSLLPLLAGLECSVLPTSGYYATLPRSARTPFNRSGRTFPPLFTEDALPPLLQAIVEENGNRLLESSCFTYNGMSEVITISPVTMRYFIECTLLMQELGSLNGKDILEIGGGYGGMAVVVQSLFRVRSYSVVDLAVCGLLQQKFVRRHTLHIPSLKMHPVLSSERSQPLRSDVLFSFFAISELHADVVDEYMSLYVRHATSGYLQLNFDEETETSQASIMKNRLVPALEMFRRVLVLHPCASLRGASPLYEDFAGQHETGLLRIIWKDCYAANSSAEF